MIMVDVDDKEDIIDLLHSLNTYSKTVDTEKFGLPLDDPMDRETLTQLVQTWLEENFLDV